MKGLHKIAWVLLIIGGLNWLLVGIFQNDLGSWVLGGMDSIVSRIVYILVGLSALIAITGCKSCKAKKGGAAPAAPAQGGGGNEGAGGGM